MYDSANIDIHRQQYKVVDTEVTQKVSREDSELSHVYISTGYGTVSVTNDEYKQLNAGDKIWLTLDEKGNAYPLIFNQSEYKTVEDSILYKEK